MMDADENSDTTPDDAPYVFNGKPVTDIEYLRHDVGTGLTFDVVFYDGESEVARTYGHSIEGLQTVVGRENAELMTHSLKHGFLDREVLEPFNGMGFTSEPKTTEVAREVEAAEEANTIERDDRSVVKADAERADPPVAKADTKKGEAEAPAPARKTAKTDDTDRAQSDDDARRAEILRQVTGQFNVQGRRYHFKERGDPLAFTARETKLVTASNDTRAAVAMVAMSEGRGWDSIKVSGHSAFRQAVWMEARTRGLEVRGYKATEADQTALAERLERQARNTVEKATPREATQESTQAADKAPGTTAQRKSSSGPRTHDGRLVAHGAAPYKHDPKAKQSYYATLETDRGQQTVWGKDLERAISESGRGLGSRVSLINTGSKPVTVIEDVRDTQGKVTGTRELLTNLNQWKVQGHDRSDVVESVAGKLFDEEIDDPNIREAIKASMSKRLEERERAGTVPAVPMYDSHAPAAAAKREHEHAQDKAAERSR